MIWSQAGLWGWYVMTVAAIVRTVIRALPKAPIAAPDSPAWVFPEAGKNIEAALRWVPGCSAFWLDPDLWHGVGDTHRDMCWMHLDQRPPAAVPEASEREQEWRPTPAALKASRADALDGVYRADRYEEQGFTALAAELRDDSMTRLRNILNAEKEAQALRAKAQLEKAMSRPGAIIRISGGAGATPVGINGKVLVIQHGVDVRVSGEQLEALTNSNVQFERRPGKQIPMTGARR